MSEEIKQQLKKHFLLLSVFIFLITSGFTSLETKADLVFQEIRQWQIASDAEYLSNPSFTGGTTGWTLSITAYNSTYYQDTAGSIETTAGVGRNNEVDGTATQTIGTDINSSDTVTLTLYWSKRCVSINCTTNSIYVEIEKPSSPGVWTEIWSDLTVPSFDGATSWASVSQDVSASFDETGTYAIRYRSNVRNGNNANAESFAWFDNTGLDVVSSGNAVPVLSNLSLNAGSNFAPNPGTVVDVTISGKAIDDDGCSGLGGFEGQAYVSAEGINCSASNSNCYIDLSCNTSCTGSVADVSCPASIWFYAEATDDLATQAWVGAILVTDSANATAETTDEASEEVEMTGALCVSVIPASIAYGTISVGGDSGSSPRSVLVENLCNTALDVSVSGDDMTTSAEDYTIIVTSQHYATETFTYNDAGSATEVSLLTGAANVEIDSAKPTTSPTDSSDEIFWGIAVPAGADNATDYGGENTFTAIND